MRKPLGIHSTAKYNRKAGWAIFHLWLLSCECIELFWVERLHSCMMDSAQYAGCILLEGAGLSEIHTWTAVIGLAGICCIGDNVM